MISAGITILALSYGLLWSAERARMSEFLHIGALAIGVIILDVGAQMIQVANQTRIFGLDSSARSRLNTVYMTVYFSGAAAGSALSTIAWVHWKWNGVCGLALGLVALAALRHVTGHSRLIPHPQHSRRQRHRDPRLESPADSEALRHWSDLSPPPDSLLQTACPMFCTRLTHNP